MLPTLVIAALVIVGLFVFVGARPDSFRRERSISINAVPEKGFALINDFHEWSHCSPWDKFDPALQRTYSGPASGVEITGAAPNAKLAVRSARSAGATCLICSATTSWRCRSAWALRRACAVTVRTAALGWWKARRSGSGLMASMHGLMADSGEALAV